MLRQDWRLQQVWNIQAPDIRKGLLTSSTQMVRAAETFMTRTNAHIRLFYSGWTTLRLVTGTKCILWRHGKDYARVDKMKHVKRFQMTLQAKLSIDKYPALR
jgi:hypothetical protein